MNSTKLCINSGMILDCNVEERLKMIKDVGFDAFFYDKEKNTDYKKAEQYAEAGAKNNLYFHSIHAPFYGMDNIWHDEEGSLAKIMEKDLLASIDECKRFDVPLVIMHAIIGMDKCTPTQLGIDRLYDIIDYAVKNDITIGFENTEGEMYLEKIFETYGNIKNVRFCFDSGHEMCYNYSHDLLAKYGKYLVSTHLNDNLGMTDVNNMTFLDDSHLLPFDGIRDWEKTAESLHKCGYDGILTFEVIKKSKPGRTANDIYNDLSDEEYFKEAYSHADRFRQLYNTVKK